MISLRSHFQNYSITPRNPKPEKNSHKIEGFCPKFPNLYPDDLTNILLAIELSLTDFVSPWNGVPKRLPNWPSFLKNIYKIGGDRSGNL